MKSRIAFFFLLVTAATVYAQKPKEVLKWINTAQAINKDFYYEIPFEYRNNEIVIKVTVGNQTYDYIFDTGGYNNITDAMQGKNNFPVLTTQTVGSSNQIKTKINIVKVDTLKIGEMVFTDIAALQMNYDNSPIIKCTIDGGLIGASIIKNYAWQIDYPNKKIIVTDQFKKLPNLQNAIKLPVTFNSRLMPYLTVKINGKKEKMMFDLGSSTLFSMTDKTAMKYANPEDIVQIEGGGTEGGNGKIDEIVSVFKAGTIEIGSIKYTNKEVLFAKSSNESLIGNAIIKDYIVTMDFKEDAIYFMPVNTITENDGWRTFGFTMEYKDGKVRVATIFKGLQADKEGLAVGDEIMFIDGKIPECNNFCECRVELGRYLLNKSKIELTIMKNGEAKEVNIAKERVF